MKQQYLFLYRSTENVNFYAGFVKRIGCIEWQQNKTFTTVLCKSQLVCLQKWHGLHEIKPI